MATIEEQAQKWAEHYMQTHKFQNCSIIQDLVTAYLAGSAQTVADYGVSGYGSI